MAHLEKYNRNATGHMLKHYERSTPATLERENIDSERSYLNYNLVMDTRTGQERLKDRLKDVYCLKRKDVNILCDWIVTAPKTLDIDKQADFFRHTYTFLNNRYGKDNVISAYVHLDEKQPHLHYAFLPVIHDKKKNRLKVSAKEVTTRKDLKTFHPELKKYLDNRLDMDIDILNGATAEGNKSIQELKQQTAVKELKQLNNKIDYAKQELEELKNINNSTGLDLMPNVKQSKINKNNVVLDKDDYNKLLNANSLNELLKKENAALNKRIAYLENSDNYNKMKDLENACFKLTYKNKNLENDLNQEKKDNKQLTQIIEHIFKKFPSVRKYIFNLPVEKNKNIDNDNIDRGKSR